MGDEAGRSSSEDLEVLSLFSVKTSLIIFEALSDHSLLFNLDIPFLALNSLKFEISLFLVYKKNRQIHLAVNCITQIYPTSVVQLEQKVKYHTRI